MAIALLMVMSFAIDTDLCKQHYSACHVEENYGNLLLCLPMKLMNQEQRTHASAYLCKTTRPARWALRGVVALANPAEERLSARIKQLLSKREASGAELWQAGT